MSAPARAAGVGFNLAPSSYHSSTALGQQITALVAVYNAVNAASPPSSASTADSLAYNLLRTSTMASLEAVMEKLVVLDEQLIAYDAQVQAYTQKCAALATTSGAPGAPGTVSVPAAVGIGAAGIGVGGILGFIGARTIGKDLLP